MKEVGPQGHWFRFSDVERTVGMSNGSLSALWAKMQPKEHGRTRQKTTQTETQKALGLHGLYFENGYLAVVAPGKPIVPAGPV